MMKALTVLNHYPWRIYAYVYRYKGKIFAQWTYVVLHTQQLSAAVGQNHSDILAEELWRTFGLI